MDDADNLTVRNSTFAGNAKYGVYLAGSVNDDFRNGIVTAAGAGAYALYAAGTPGSVTAASDYNDIYVSGGAQVGALRR